jgi:lysyl-tRNA synthetase class 2
VSDPATPSEQSERASSGDFRPTASLETLRQRARLLTAVRAHFDAAGYWEVETPILSRDTVVDAWLEPFVTRDKTCADGRGPELFLQTSPEFGMKRLLAAGATAIYQITRAFRQGENGQRHNPEFTIIEWYKVGDSYHDQMAFVEEFVTAMLHLGSELCVKSNCKERAQPPFERITYDRAFEKHTGSSVLNLTGSELVRLAEQLNVQPPATLRADDKDGWLNLLLAERVEPHLGSNHATFLFDYPASQAALATIRDDTPPVAERFELYVDGVELCNGYQELTDPEELQQRMLQQSVIRNGEGLRALPLENRLLDAMRAGLPTCAGVALGFDRLTLLALGKRSLAEVTAFPNDRA